MENMSKALLMAAGVLIGVMTLAIIVMLFNQGGEFSSSYDRKLSLEAIQNYNQPFTRLLTINTTSEEQEIDIYDIISVVNYAKNINYNLGYPNPNDNYNYITINIMTKINSTSYFELRINSTEKKEMKDIAGSSFSQEDYHDMIKEMADKKFGITIKSYNIEEKVNKVDFYIIP